MRTSTKTPASAARAASANGVSASTPSSGFAVKASAPQAGRVAERRRRRADERLRVGGRGDVDVAALGVGDDEQPGRARVVDGRLQRGPAVRAEALEARELRLDGHAGRAGGVDERGAVLADGGRGALRGRAVGGRALDRLRPQARRIGVQAQHDLRLARRDERGEAVAEPHGPTCGRPA